MDDDDLDRLLRAANPARTPLDAKPDAQLLARIMNAPRPHRQRWLPRSSQRFALFIAPLTAVAIAVAAVILGGSFTPAAAYGPPPLTWIPTQQTPEEAVQMAQQQLSTSADPAAQRESYATSWSLTVSEAGEPQESTTISPLVTTLEWNEDLSGRRVVKAGKPYEISGESIASDATRPGTLIDDTVFAVGEYPALVPDAGTLDATGFQNLLAAYAPPGDGSKAGDAMLAVTDVMSEWTLSNAQHAQILDALLRYDGLVVEGTTKDRLGREVVGLRSAAALRPGEATTLLVSADTGRIVGVEIAVTGQEASTPVPTGTVIHYSLWKDSE